MPLNCVLEKTLESPLDCKEIQPVHPKGNKSWIFIGRTDAEPETPMLWLPEAQDWLTGKTLMLERLKAGGGGDNKAWDCWMVSMTRWTWVWVNSRSWSWTGRPGLLQSMGSQRVGHDWATELNKTERSLSSGTLTCTASVQENSWEQFCSMLALQSLLFAKVWYSKTN